MSLSKKVKTGLDEIRILILGSQILLGFACQTAFRPGFEGIPAHDRAIEIASLASIALTIGLIIAPSMQHRIIAGGEDTPRILRVIRLFATCSLAPFALALGADVFLVVEHVLGLAPGILAGAAFSSLALLFWYGLEILKARGRGRERWLVTDEDPQAGGTPLETKVEQLLTETRVVLPGAQALFGFQLIIVFSDAFEQLPSPAKGVHLAALGFVALTVIWLMAPAAFHRIVYDGEDTPAFLRTGSRFLLMASVTLAFGIAGDLGVVVGKVTRSGGAGEAAAGLCLAMLLGLWHLYPMWKRFSDAET